MNPASEPEKEFITTQPTRDSTSIEAAAESPCNILLKHLLHAHAKFDPDVVDRLLHQEEQAEKFEVSDKHGTRTITKNEIEAEKQIANLLGLAIDGDTLIELGLGGRPTVGIIIASALMAQSPRIRSNLETFCNRCKLYAEHALEHSEAILQSKLFRALNYGENFDVESCIAGFDRLMISNLPIEDKMLVTKSFIRFLVGINHQDALDHSLEVEKTLSKFAQCAGEIGGSSRTRYALFCREVISDGLPKEIAEQYLVMATNLHTLEEIELLKKECETRALMLGLELTERIQFLCEAAPVYRSLPLSLFRVLQYLPSRDGSRAISAIDLLGYSSLSNVINDYHIDTIRNLPADSRWEYLEFLYRKGELVLALSQAGTKLQNLLPEFYKEWSEEPGQNEEYFDAVIYTAGNKNLEDLRWVLKSRSRYKEDPYAQRIIHQVSRWRGSAELGAYILADSTDQLRAELAAKCLSAPCIKSNPHQLRRAIEQASAEKIQNAIEAENPFDMYEVILPKKHGYVLKAPLPVISTEEPNQIATTSTDFPELTTQETALLKKASSYSDITAAVVRRHLAQYRGSALMRHLVSNAALRERYLEKLSHGEDRVLDHELERISQDSNSFAFRSLQALFPRSVPLVSNTATSDSILSFITPTLTHPDAVSHLTDFPYKRLIIYGFPFSDQDQSVLTAAAGGEFEIIVRGITRRAPTERDFLPQDLCLFNTDRLDHSTFYAVKGRLKRMNYPYFMYGASTLNELRRLVKHLRSLADNTT